MVPDPSSVMQLRLFLRSATTLRVRMRDAYAFVLWPFRRSRYWKDSPRRTRMAGVLRAMLTYDSFSQRMPQVGRLHSAQTRRGND